MLDGLTSRPLAPEQDSVGTGWRTERKLVERQNLATGIKNAVLGRFGEPQSGDSEFGNGQQTDVICDGSDLDDDF